MSWKHYKELIVWQKSMDLVESVYSLTKSLPSDERYALTDQIRRAVVSIPSNIAEGHGRQTDKEYKQYLSIAKGSVSEVETQLMICVRLNYLTEQQTESVLVLCDEIRRMLTKIITTFQFPHQE